MIVCSCARVTDRDIHQAIAWMRASDPYALITPGKIYRALGKSAECGGCIRHFVENMRRDANMAVPVELRQLRTRVAVAVAEGRLNPTDLERLHIALVPAPA